MEKIDITVEQIEEARLKIISGQEAFFLNAAGTEKAATVNPWGSVLAMPGYEVVQSGWSIVHQKWGMSYWEVKNREKEAVIKLEPLVIEEIVASGKEMIKEQEIATEEAVIPTEKKAARKKKSI